MAWERRGPGRVIYYYRGVRRDGRVVKQYFGSGQRALQAAQEDDLKRRQRSMNRSVALEEQLRYAEIIALGQRLEYLSQLLLDVVMYSEGLHRQKRGPWRKRRECK